MIQIKRLLLFLFLLFTPAFALPPPSVSATSAIAIDSISGRILYEKDAFTKKPMASTTKIMTAIIAVENNNLNEIVTISKKASNTGGSSLDLVAGQEIKLEELLYGLLLKSGNDAAIAIAEHTSGTVENFANLMNQKAIEIGALSTNFVTPHGLDVPNHYSTAYDMAIISRYSMNNPVIRKIVSTRERNIYFTNGLSKYLTNTNKLLVSYIGADGIKTGYTGMAGRCLLGSATHNNWRIITVVFGEPTSALRILDTQKILDYCFTNYKLVKLNDLYDINFTIPIEKGTANYIIPEFEEELIIPLRTDEKNAITIRKNLSSNLIAPIQKEKVVGSISFMLGKEFIGQINLLPKQDIPRLSVGKYYAKMLDALLSLKVFV